MLVHYFNSYRLLAPTHELNINSKACSQNFITHSLFCVPQKIAPGFLMSLFTAVRQFSVSSILNNQCVTTDIRDSRVYKEHFPIYMVARSEHIQCL